MPDDDVTPRPGAVQIVVVALVVLAAAFHLGTITLSALPDNRYSEAARPASGYLGPFFAQNWRLFAPNPVSSDRAVMFQGAYEDADGSIARTEWVSWTDVELDLIRHRLVGGRGGYVTNKLFGPLGSRYRGLDTAQRDIADVAEPEDVEEWGSLATRLYAKSNDPLDDNQVKTYLAYDRATTRLGTQVLTARHPDTTWLAVRYKTWTRDVTPWNQRHASGEDRERLRRSASERVNGWRVAVAGSAAEQAVVADFDRRHR